MSKLYLGSIDLKKIDKSKIFEGKNGGKWINVTIYIDDEPNKFGQSMSIQQSTKKDEQNIYLGNCKEWGADNSQPQRQESSSGSEGEEDQLPF